MRRTNRTNPQDINIEPKPCLYCDKEMPVTLYYVRDQRYETRQYISESRTRYEYNRKNYCDGQCAALHRKQIKDAEVRELASKDSLYERFCFPRPV